jgi:hypothetical protein
MMIGGFDMAEKPRTIWAEEAEQGTAMRSRPERAVSTAELLCGNALASLRRGNAGKADEALELLGRDARVRRALEVGRHIPRMNTSYILPSLADQFDESADEGAETISGLRVELLAGSLVFHREDDVREAARNYRFDGVGITEERLKSIIGRAGEGASEEELARAGFIALVELIGRGDFGQADRVIKNCRLGPRQVGDAAIIAYFGKIHPNLIGRGMEGFVPPPVLQGPMVLDNLCSAHPGCFERFGVGWLIGWSRTGLGRIIEAEAD